MENSITQYVYLTSAFSVEGIKDGLSMEGMMSCIVVEKGALKEFQNAQLVKMIKSLDDEASVTHKDSKDVLVPALYKALESLEVEHVEVKKASRSGSTGCTRKSSGPSTKDTCYAVFKDYNLADKDDSKLALADAMKACEMAEDDVKSKRVVQSYMSYYRNDVKSGKITDGKTVYEAAAPQTEEKSETDGQ